MGKTLSDADWQEDLNALARLSECSPGEIKGYILITVMRDHMFTVATNACCEHHAAHHLVDIATTQMLPNPVCSGEH